MTYPEFLENLNKRGMFRIRPRLDRIETVLQELGSPQNTYPSIHIAGTNGKGSVAAALESVLRSSGYRTGLYTSPHLIDLRERIKIAGEPIKKSFLSYAADVFAAETSAKSPLTYFELLTAIAFHSFRKENVEIAIVECGMGGKWDATNTIQSPLLSIITSIGLDHRDYLGGTEAQIARQKAGIIKNGRPLILGVRGTVKNVLVQEAHKKRCRLVQIESNFRAYPVRGSQTHKKQDIRFLSNGSPAETVPFGLLGTHQVDNVAIVMAAIGELRKQGWEIPVHKRNQGLLKVDWPGRFQVILAPKKAAIILDGAHNPPAMKKLIESIESSAFNRSLKTFIFSAFKDKDVSSMGRYISAVAHEVCLCPLPSPRASKLTDLRAAVRGVKGPIRNFATPQEALQGALRDTPSDGLVVVAGSLSLVGEILKSLTSKRSTGYVHA